MKYFNAVKKRISTARSGARYNYDNFSNNWSVDISFDIHNKKFAIEYDGKHWHDEKMNIDERKSVELLAAGFIIIRLRETGLEPLNIKSPYYHEIFVQPNGKDFDKNTECLLDCIMKFIENGEWTEEQERDCSSKKSDVNSNFKQKPHSWSPEEEQYLINHQELTVRELAKYFGVSKKAVERKREKLKKRFQ